MSQGAVRPQLRGGSRQGLDEIANEQPISRRYAIGMSRYLAIEYIDIAAPELTSEMIVGASIAEAELQHIAGQVIDQSGCKIDAGALRLEPTNEGF